MTTQSTTGRAVLVDSGRCTGQYDLPRRDALVDDAKLGRLYITQAFGGIDTIKGGAYRWGLVIQVPPGTTIEQARQIEPMAPDTKIVDWEDGVVDRYMQALGL